MVRKKGDKKLLSVLKSGATLEAACKAANVDLASILKRMEEEPDWTCKVASSLAEAEMEYLDTLRQAAKNGDWRAAAWWLERRGHGFSKEALGKEREKKGSRRVEIRIRKASGKSKSKKKGGCEKR